MSTVNIKDPNSDSMAVVDANGRLHVSGDSVGTTGTTAPTSVTEVGGVNSAGNIQPVSIDNTGALIVSGNLVTVNEGFSIISPGYPTQVSVGTTSVQLFPANNSRKYAHITNNSQAPIYIQYQVSAALNQGIKLSPGSFFTLNSANLWLGIINAIGLQAGQFIDVLQGE